MLTALISGWNGAAALLLAKVAVEFMKPEETVKDDNCWDICVNKVTVVS